MNSTHFFPAALRRFSAAIAILGLTAVSRCQAEPLRLHPENPHYFLFRGKPTLIVTSGEHYGAVLNLDFDYTKYLECLARGGLNGTRTWAGAYCEPLSAFNIASNTLAPLPGRFICPWARSAQPGYANGGTKFDLTRWDESYFKRLKEFMTQAGRRGIVVELNLFCPFYDESMWRLSPMNAANNINGAAAIARTNVYTLDKSGSLLPVQEAMVRKLVTELKDFDNLYYEICNEPYFGGVTLEWQRHIADIITETESGLGVRHLISQNIANGKAKVMDPHPSVSILNFHYASPPDTVAMNYGLNRVIGDNETGFCSTNDAPYRLEAWDFIVAGGGLFNHLDYSFVAGQEGGTFAYPASQPGGGNATLRQEFRFLSEFIKRSDFLHMHPENEVVLSCVPAEVTARALVKPGTDYIIYGHAIGKNKSNNWSSVSRFADNEVVMELNLPEGQYSAEWFNTKTGARVHQEKIAHSGGARKFLAPAFEDDIALSVRKVSRP